MNELVCFLGSAASGLLARAERLIPGAIKSIPPNSIAAGNLARIVGSCG